MIDMTPLPMAFSQMHYQQLVEQHPVVKLVNAIVDYQLWLFLQLYYAPYTLASKGDDVDKWISSLSLNGARWSNLCKPNVTK